MRHNLEVIFTLGVMDLKLKYQSSRLGFLWSFLKPLLQFIVYYLVFAVFFHVGKGYEYPLILFLGVLLWGFFTEGTSLGLNAYLGKKSIVTKINVKKILLPIAAYITPALNFVLNFFVFFGLYCFFSVHSIHYLTIFKSVIAFLMFVDIGIIIVCMNVILANLNAIFRDIQNIWELILQYGVFITPIIYPLPIPEEYLCIYFFFNVLAFPIECLKSQFFVYETKIYDIQIITAHMISLLILSIVSMYIHKKISNKVADYL